MFIKVTKSHSSVTGAGMVKNKTLSTEYVNFDYVVKFYRNETREFTLVSIDGEDFIGVTETPEEILEKLK